MDHDTIYAPPSAKRPRIIEAVNPPDVIPESQPTELLPDLPVSSTLSHADEGESEAADLLPDFFELKEYVPTKFKLQLRDSKSFKGSNWAEEKTFSFEPVDSDDENDQQNSRDEPQPSTSSSAAADAASNQRDQSLMIENIPQMTRMFDTLIETAKKQYDRKDTARMYIDHPDMDGSHITVGPMRLANMTTSRVMDRVQFTLRSAERIPFNQRLRMNLAVVRNVSGSGKRDGFYRLDFERDRTIKRCVVQVPSPNKEDKNCLPRAILIAHKYLEAEKLAEGVECKKKRNAIISKARYFANPKASKKLEKMVKEMKEAVGLSGDSDNDAGELQHVSLYEKHLEVSICILSGKLEDKIIYQGSDEFRGKNRRIYLYHWLPMNGSDWHFDVIRSMSAFMETAYYCYECDTPYHHKDQHSCNQFCSVCMSTKCEIEKSDHLLVCEDCNRTCRSQKCYLLHKKEKGKKPSLCSQKYKCNQCEVVLKDKERPRRHHVCTESYCRNCQQWFANVDESKPHFCHMRALPAEEPIERFIFYDFESTQESGTHIPNMVIAQSCCKFCAEDEDVKEGMCIFCGTRCKDCDKWCNKSKEFLYYPCVGEGKICGKREVVFRGENVTQDFGQWLVSRQHRNTTVIAHNAKGYDNYFILNYLLKASITPSVIFQGSQATYMHVGKGINLRFLDSLMFLPMGLAQLPKCFDLTEMKKGYFPHYFNKPANYNTVQEGLPSKEDYGYKTMTAAKQAAFDKWYSQNEKILFDFEREMEDYCRSDVDILRRACMTYRNLMMQVTDGVDPFTFVSAASVCMGVFRARFLKEQWEVLRKGDVSSADCPHDFDTCQCSWRPAEKLHGNAPIVELHQLSEEEKRTNPIVKTRFVSSDVGLLPPTEYRSSDNYSVEALSWLQREEKLINETLNYLGEQDIRIQTAMSPSGEKKVSLPRWNGEHKATSVKLDGYYEDPITGWKVAFEFYGCHWHGCPKCFPKVDRRRDTKCQGRSLEQRYNATMIREERLRNQGYIVRSIWACEYAKEIGETNVPLFPSSPLYLRDSYFGGRTAPVKLYHNFDESKGEIGKYVDFTSLYPWALKYGTFPVSHPICYRGSNVKDCQLANGEWSVSVPCTGEAASSGTRHCPENVSHLHHHLNFFGIVKAKISPPEKLLHPVIPYRCESGKLVFTLCAHCAEKNNQEGECNCPQEKRDWIATLTSIELEVALDAGYVIKEIFEILHWPKKSSNIFAGYVNTFLRIKQEASGLPEHVQTESEIDDYIATYEREEGIKMERRNLKKSSALRSLAKLMLNSIYGKFGQRLNLRKSHMVDNVKDLCKLMCAQDKTVVDFRILSEDIMQIETVNNEHFDETDLKTNVLVSIFTASWARLKLLTVMQQLGDRVLYTDTDSLIYISHKEIGKDPPLGDFLGQLTDELCCKNVGCPEGDHQPGYHYMTEFVTGGPKNYAYKLNNGECECKIRGFTLDAAAARHLNFHSLKSQVFDYVERRFSDEKEKEKERNIISISRNQIRRDKVSFELYNQEISKRYGVVLDKSRIQKDFSTVPFGTRARTEQ